jgi:hypothetical protein
MCRGYNDEFSFSGPFDTELGVRLAERSMLPAGHGPTGGDMNQPVL